MLLMELFRSFNKNIYTLVFSRLFSQLSLELQLMPTKWTHILTLSIMLKVIFQLQLISHLHQLPFWLEHPLQFWLVTSVWELLSILTHVLLSNAAEENGLTIMANRSKILKRDSSLLSVVDKSLASFLSDLPYWFLI